ncbi:hypothetical protein BC937DRAFT_89960 [Endogone sp. FLAS-F59071]|nr:hypothetical protein BC937DRAFT_89960 [Endogone sp. FLAS-F59071]|eukprot:RUS17456.1 hypothetical protein BC937DRAFT_89960 [Endogone sp. FLAS-F59071]
MKALRKESSALVRLILSKNLQQLVHLKLLPVCLLHHRPLWPTIPNTHPFPSAHAMRSLQYFSADGATSTANVVKTTHCPGCGAKFQTADPSKPGFVPQTKPRDAGAIDPPSFRKASKSPKVMSKADIAKTISELDDDIRRQLLGVGDGDLEGFDDNDNDAIPPRRQRADPRSLCHRCYNLTYYNALTTPTTAWQDTLVTNDHSFLRFLRKRQNAVVVQVVDILDFPYSLTPGLDRLVGPDHPVILAVNKIDLLPNGVLEYQDRIRRWVRHQAKLVGASRIHDVCLISAKKNLGVRELCASVAKARRAADNVYLVGQTNVGKSELINTMLRLGNGGTKHKVTSSVVPGTTIGMVEIPLAAFGSSLGHAGNVDQRALYDTPGIVDQRQIVHLLDHEELKMIVPDRPIRPVTYRFESGKSLLLGGLARLDILSATSPLLITLFSKIPPHITSTSKADRFLERLSPSSDSSNNNSNTTTITNTTNTTTNTTLLQPPILSPLRRPFPPLQSLPGTLMLRNDHSTRAGLDIVFVGVGWVSIGGTFDRAEARVWCPGGGELGDGRVMMREPALLPYEFRGSVRKFFGDGRRSVM